MKWVFVFSSDSNDRTTALFPALPPRRSVDDEHRILVSSNGYSETVQIMSSHTKPINRIFVVAMNRSSDNAAI